MSLIAFTLVMLVVATAVAAPWAWMRGDRSREADALAIGASLLGGGSGAVVFGIIAYFHATQGVEGALLYGGLSLLAALAAPIGLHAALRSRSRALRGALLVAAAAFTLGGSLMVAVFPVGGALAFVASLCYLGALCNPRSILGKLDPRLPPT